MRPNPIHASDDPEVVRQLIRENPWCTLVSNNAGELVDHFERRVDRPRFLDPAWGAQLARGTVGLRIPISRFVCKIKLSQDKSLENQRRVVAALRAPGPYHHPALADDMERSIVD